MDLEGGIFVPRGSCSKIRKMKTASPFLKDQKIQEQFRSSLVQQETLDYPFRDPEKRKLEKESLTQLWAIRASQELKPVRAKA